MTPAVGLIVARALLYGGALVALGLTTYLAYAPAVARMWLAEQRWPWRWVAVATVIALAASAVHLLLLTAAMNGVAPHQVDREMLRFVATEMPVGSASLVRLVALVVVLGLTFRRGHQRLAGCIAAALIAVVSLAWNGHAMMNEGAKGWLHMLLDQLHLVAAAVWLGALVALLGLSRAEGADGHAARAEAFAAFSFVGTIVVATLVLTGIVSATLITRVPGGGDPAREYLAVLALKVAVFLGALGLAAHNRYHLSPPLATPDAGLARRLKRSVSIELGLLLVIVAVVAVLGTLSPTA